MKIQDIILIPVGIIIYALIIPIALIVIFADSLLIKIKLKKFSIVDQYTITGKRAGLFSKTLQLLNKWHLLP